MRSSRAKIGLALTIVSLVLSPVAWGTAEPRLQVDAATTRIQAIESSLTTRVDQVSHRYGYEVVQQTVHNAAQAQGQTLGRSAKPLSTRVYALWAGVVRRVDSELARLHTSRAAIVAQSFATTRDVEWLEHAGSRIHRELASAESCLDELVESTVISEAHGVKAKNLRKVIRRRRATLARFPGSADVDPLADLTRQARFDELVAASARATAYGLEDVLSALASKQWMPALEPQERRREISLRDVELPPGLLAANPVSDWVTGASTGVRLARAVAEFSHRGDVLALTRDAELALLERATDSRDAVDKGQVRSLQIEGISLARRARRLSSGLERLPELRSVVVFANGTQIFEAKRPRIDELERLRESVLRKSGALNEMLDAVLLLRRQFVFHAMAAERGRGLRASGEPVDIRPTIRQLFASSRAGHLLDGAQRSDLESFYTPDHLALAQPQHLRDAVEGFLKGTNTPPPRETPSPRPGVKTTKVSGRSGTPDAQATLAVARLLAKLSDDRANVPLRAAKRAIRRWKFPVPGYPERPKDAVQVLADDLTAWVHLPAAMWSEAAFQSLVASLRTDITKLREWTTRHRPIDGLSVSESVTIHDGMHIEVLLALSAEHEGALKVEFAGDVLAGEGLYMSDTPGLLFTTSRLKIGERAGTKAARIRILLP
jgi:hypothetical protein